MKRKVTKYFWRWKNDHDVWFLHPEQLTVKQAARKFAGYKYRIY